MNIIEKLGIKPIEFVDGDYICGGEWIPADEVRELEQQRNELLEALIKTTAKMEEECHAHNWDAHCPARTRMNWNMLVIGKACEGKTWEEIKELLK